MEINVDANQLTRNSGNNAKKAHQVLRYCLVRGCYNSSVTRPDLKYIPVPKPLALSRAWFKKCNDPNLIGKYPKPNHRICSEHFLPSDFNPPWMQQTLKENTIPSVFNNLGNKQTLYKNKVLPGVGPQLPQSLEVEEKLPQSLEVEEELPQSLEVESLGTELDLHSYSNIQNVSNSTPYNTDCDSTRQEVESSKMLEVENPFFEVEVNSCRLCLQSLGEKAECLWRNCGFTELGYKFCTITEVEESHYYVFKTLHCCHECALKIQVCFSLYVEIRTMETILVKIKHHSEDALLQKDKQLMRCNDCMEDVLGIQAFIEHTKQHIVNGHYGDNEDELMGDKDNEDEVMGDEDNESQEKINEDFELKKKIDKPEEVVEVEYFNQQFQHFSNREKQVLLDGFNNMPNDDDSDDNDDDEVIDIAKFELDYHDDTDDDDVFKDNIEVKNEKYICPKCAQCFDYKFELRYHLVRHDSTYWTTIGILGVVPRHNREIKKKWTLIQRKEKLLMKKKEAKLSAPKIDIKKRKELKWCRYCFELFSSEFKSHVQKCRSKFKEGENVLCHFCGLYVDPHKYIEHFRKHWEDRSHIRRQKEARGICFKCNKHFSSALKTHKPCYEPDTTACVHCGQLVTKKKMSDHVKRKHNNNQAKYGCPLCERRFIYEYEVDAHLMRHEDYDTPFEIICRRCSLHITDLKHFQLHLVNDHFYNHKRVKQCDHCEKRFVILHEYNDHLINEHGVPRETIKEKCQQCNKFIPILQIAAHRIKCFIKKTKLECPICFQKTKTDKNMDLHLLKHKQINTRLDRVCSFCKANFKFLIDFQNHVAAYHKPKKIKNRKKSKKMDTAVEEYVIEKAPVNDDQDEGDNIMVVYECQYCELGFIASEMLVEHKMAYHQVAAQDSVVKSDYKIISTGSNSKFTTIFYE